MNFLGKIVLTLTIFVSLGQTRDVNSSSRRVDTVVAHLVEALERGFDFFGNDAEEINLDGMYGLRMAQGAFLDVLEDEQALVHLRPETVTKLRALTQLTTTIYDKAARDMRENSESYFSSFQTLIDRPFRVKWRARSLKQTKANDAGSEVEKTSHYDEHKGDECFIGILNKNDCTVSKKCLDMMTEKDRSWYSLTHQLLYFMLAENSGCLPQLQVALQQAGMSSNIESYFESFCIGIYEDADDIVNKEFPNVFSNDLFMEQSSLCLAIGYKEFLRVEWASQVLSKQRVNGCYGSGDPSNPIVGRRLLVEQGMNGGCGSHETGLSCAYFALFLKNVVLQKDAIQWDE